MTNHTNEKQTAGGRLTPEALDGARKSLENATTLPAEAFTSPDVYGREIEAIFLREWLCAGRVDQVPNPGDYFSLDLLGDRLVVVRGKDDEVRVLSRVCRHRAAEVVSGQGNARSFQCPYHSWSYQLDGALIGAPFMESAEGFDRDACRLPALRSEVWEGWIFVNFDSQAAPLGPQLAPLSKLLARYQMSKMVAVETATFDSQFNWKVLTDNFMEAYHHIAIHRDTLEPLFPAKRSNVPDNDGPYSVLNMPLTAGVESGEAFDGLIAATVFPFHLFAPTLESLVWFQFLPGDFDRFQLRIFICFPPEVLADSEKAGEVQSLQDFVKAIHHQDIGACETVWAGLQDRSFDSGPLSVLEKSIWQFNQWWIERMMVREAK